MQEMRTGISRQLCRKYVMRMIEHLHILLANQFMHCQRILAPISQIHIISTAKSHLNHAISIKKVSVSEESTVDILMTLHIKMIMNNDQISLNPDDNKPKPVTRDDRQTSTNGFSKTQRGQLNYVKSSAPSQSATSAFSSSSSSSVRQPASNDARNSSSWKNESQPGYKRSSLGSLRINTKRKHIADDDANISSHDEQSDAYDITIASNIVQPIPEIL